MIGRLPPEAAATPSERSDRRARNTGLAIVATGTLTAIGAATIGGQSDLGVSARVVTSCTVSSDAAATAGTDIVDRDTACAARREVRANGAPAKALPGNSTTDRENRVTSYDF